jgi:DnaJ-class molecular chaperone
MENISHVHLCPVCEGSGKLRAERKCHGCDGKGWVVVWEQVITISGNPPTGTYFTKRRSR